MTEHKVVDFVLTKECDYPVERDDKSRVTLENLGVHFGDGVEEVRDGVSIDFGH